jgi:hypothetical protein
MSIQNSSGSITRAEMVVLAPQQDTMYRSIDMDPQSVIAREPHASIITLNTIDLAPGLPRNDFVISNNITYFSNTSRISPLRAEFYNYYIPNVNPRNNNIVFYSSVTNSNHSVIVPEGYYNSASDLSLAIIAAMNSVSGASGLTFVGSSEPLSPDTFNVISTPGNYYFVNTCSAVKYGESLWNLDERQIAQSEHFLGPMSLQYTWWVDIVSDKLTQYAKKRSVASNSKSSVFARMSLNVASAVSTATSVVPWGRAFDDFSIADISYSFRPMESITAIDIALYDMYGQLLYIPARLNDKLLFTLQFKAIL